VIREAADLRQADAVAVERDDGLQVVGVAGDANAHDCNGVSVRVLIVTADIGAGHDLPARLLAEAIEDRGASVTVVDAIEEAGGILKAATRTGAETVLRRLPWLFALQYFLAATFRPTQAFVEWAGTRLGRPTMQRLVAAHRPDVVVSNYPASTEILGHMRAHGRLGVPVVAAITDLAALRYWAHPGMDAHLLIHEESHAEVAQIAGTRHPIVHARGMVRPAFERPPSRAEARRALDLDGDVPIVLVSGGGWGVGDLQGAIDVALELPDTFVVALCGRNDAVRAALEARFRPDERVRIEGFTERMPDYLAAADALVHSTAGLTVCEAIMRGCAPISYGWGRAHIRVNNRAYVRFGLAQVAADPTQLRETLAGALAQRPEPDRSFARLPSAASVVLETIGMS